MKKMEYLLSNDVKGFIEWMLPRISGREKFEHSYVMLKNNKQWRCNSIYDAYLKYDWNFSCTMPNGTKVWGHSFSESKQLLSKIKKEMKNAIKYEDSKKLLAYSKTLLEWGGVVRSNYEKLEKMGPSIVSYYRAVSTFLDPKIVDTNYNFSEVHMNSGFTKIYSMIVDDFAIYDSRVGASLGLLVRGYLEDNSIYAIPEKLNFSYGNARPTKSDKGTVNKRNPSSKKYEFSPISYKEKHIQNNICANWLFKELAEKSCFRKEENPIRALESALFMIGYKVNNSGELPD